MKNKCLLLALLVAILTLLPGCGLVDGVKDFVTGTLEFNYMKAHPCNLYGIEMSEVIIYGDDVFYLSQDGTVYYPTTCSEYSLDFDYLDLDKRIILEDVNYFHGDWYIDKENNLYVLSDTHIALGDEVWENQPVDREWFQKDTFQKCAPNVKTACVELETLSYITTSNELYAAGKVNNKTYSSEAPLLLDTGVSSMDLFDDNVIWATNDGQVKTIGESMEKYNVLADRWLGKKIDKLQICTDRTLYILADHELWLYGDIGELVPEHPEANVEKLWLLGTDVKTFSASYAGGTVAYLKEDGTAYLWGGCVTGPAVSEEAYLEYHLSDCIDYKLAENVRSVTAESCRVSYVDNNGSTFHYYRDIRYRYGKYGNSVDRNYVGIYEEPATWVENPIEP